MKIYVLPVADQFRPGKSSFRSPAHGEDWGVEPDMLKWLRRHSDFVTDEPAKADWHLFQPFYNRFYLQSWGQEGLDDLQSEILLQVSRAVPTFTVCEYDIIQMQPQLDLCGMTVFCASRQEDNGSIDVPLLCSPHAWPAERPGRKWRASFMGNYQTVSPRMQLPEVLAGRDDVDLQRGDRGEQAFVEQMLSSYCALAPRGHGGQSFRFYEAMQLGVVPMLVGEPDTRPFQSWIRWEGCSLYAKTAYDIPAVLDALRDEELLALGREAGRVYHDCLQYGRWEWFVMEELRQRR